MGRKRLFGECIVCKMIIWSDKWGKRDKTCSKECFLKLNKITHPKMLAKCPICDKKFQVYDEKSSKRKTCSSICGKKLCSRTHKLLGIKPPIRPRTFKIKNKYYGKYPQFRLTNGKYIYEHRFVVEQFL